MSVAQSEKTDLLFAAMVQAQAGVENAGKDRANPQLRNRYATLESVLDAVLPAFNRAGLAVYQSPGEVRDGVVHLTTQVVHQSGQYIRAESACPLVGYKGSGPDENKGINAAQALGVVVTYLRRYALMSVAGIVATDDDTDGDMSGRRPPEVRRGSDRDHDEPRREEPPREQPRQERREVAAARTGGSTVNFTALFERLRQIDAGWTNEAIADALGLRDVFQATEAQIIGLGRAAASGSVKPGATKTTTNAARGGRQAP